MPKNKPGTPVISENHKRFTDENTDKRIHEHLMNENDEISEEDIRNIRTDVDIKKTVANQNPVENNLSKDEDERDPEDETIRDNEDPGIDTSWNILESNP